jgi:sigma-B regulation protein RsbU (phosphoserine phosphatase)
LFDTVRGRAEIGRSFERLFAIFPDYAITMRDELFIAEGHRAAEFGTVMATQRLDLFGLPPTGQKIEYHAARLFTLQDDVIVDERRLYDFGGVLERLEKTRVDRELMTASAVQQTLMARRHATGGAFDVVGSSLPCRAIGGDFVEYVDLPDGDLWMALGDVSGKGPAAALVGAMLQGMFAMVATETATPENVLGRLNAALHRRGIGPSYATLFCGRLSAAGWLEYANAGHAPPFLVRDLGVHALTSGGPMLGVLESAAFPAERVRLEPGDTLVAYSDGVTEATAADGQDFGAAKLVAEARAAHGRPLPDLVDCLVAAVRAFTGATVLTDDATIVAVRMR